MNKTLLDAREWAANRLKEASNPPWAKEAYKGLIDALDVVLEGEACTITLEDSLLLQERQENDPQPEDCTSQPNIVQLRPRIVRVRLPI